MIGVYFVVKMCLFMNTFFKVFSTSGLLQYLLTSLSKHTQTEADIADSFFQPNAIQNFFYGGLLKVIVLYT